MKYLFHNFINTLRHYKASSLLNIVGMAVAFAAFYVILSQAKWGLTYNQGIDDDDRIFLISIPSPQTEGMKMILLCRPLAENMIASSAVVESAGTAEFSTGGDGQLIYFKEGDHVRKFRSNCHLFTKGALDVFGFEAEQGSFDDLSKPWTTAVSSRFARENNLKVGDHLSDVPSADPAPFEIVAIWRDKFTANSFPGGINMLSSLNEGNLDNWKEWSYPYFVKLKHATDKETFEQEADKEMRKVLEMDYKNPDDIEAAAEQFKVTLIPFKDLYYSTDLDSMSFGFGNGNHSTDVSLLVVALLVIVIALINFINFFFALVPARVRSVNTYKVFGTSRATLVLNFIIESVGLVVLALGLAYLLVQFFGKYAPNDMLTAPIGFAENTSLLCLTVAIALGGAIVGSLYPAFYITSFQPALVLKGSFGSSRSGRSLRNVLIGVQFTISLVLIICAIFIKLQHNYLMHFDMGFDKEYLISGYMPGDVSWWSEKNAAFEDKLRSNPDIVDVTWAQGQLVNTYRMTWGRQYNGTRIDFTCYPVAYNFLQVMGIKVTEGRDFRKSDELAADGVMIFNEQARDEYGIKLDNHGPGHNGETAEVAGFCSNFNFRPLQYDGMPFAFYMFGSDHSWRPDGLRHIYVRTAAGADPGKVMDFISQSALELCPDKDPDEFSLKLFDNELALKYSHEQTLSQLITIFTLVVIIISLMGVFGLVLFETQHRRREIAIRRVLGAGVEDILTMLCRKYAIIVAICFVVAVPVSYLVIDFYFSTFAYHTELSWWVFALAFVIVLAVTLAIVIARSISTATSNPVDSIKTE